MPHFPVTNSTLSATHLGRFLQEKYAFSQATQCQLIRAGLNDTYVVTDTINKFVFRIYSLHWRTRTEIQEEINLLQQLNQQHIAVSYAIPDQENKYIQVLNAPEGDRFAVLFTYATGQKLHNVSAQTHFHIGELMARLHSVTHNLTLKRVTYTPEVMLVDSLKQLEKFLPTTTEEMHFMQNTQNILLQEWLQADHSAIRQGIVHLDIWFDNLNIGHGDKVTLFDFDFCGNGWLCLDIAYYIMQLQNIEKYEAKAYQPKVASFMRGYESIAPISEQEKRLLPMLGVSLYFFYLGIQCQRYENWSNSFLSEDYLKRFINGLVKRYYAIHQLKDQKNDA